MKVVVLAMVALAGIRLCGVLYSWLTNPKKAAYNRVYKRTSVGCLVPVVVGGGAVLWLVLG